MIMCNKNVKTTILSTFAFFLLSVIANAQIIPQRIEINAKHSLQADQTLDMKASEVICIKEGFKMVPGSSLRLIVIPKANADFDGGHKLEETAVYPNPGVSQVIIQGFYEKSLLTIFDDSGNPVGQVLLNGANPVIDVSKLREGSYIFKGTDFTTRFQKLK
jgi:hypothetical protein